MQRYDFARQYADVLAWGRPITWQTFDDTGAGRGALARVLHGTIDECWDTLVGLNNQGAGIFATVNETDLNGRCSRNIVALRALFADDDEGGGSQDYYPVPPTFVVWSARGPHAYWALRRGEDVGRFVVAQRTIAHALGTDRLVTDLPRVMRVPGFEHHRGASVMVEIDSVSAGRRYTIDDVTRLLAAVSPSPNRATLKHGRRRGEDGWWEDLRREIAPGERNRRLFEIAAKMRGDGLGHGAILTAIAGLNQRLCTEPLSSVEVARIAKSAARYE